MPHAWMKKDIELCTFRESSTSLCKYFYIIQNLQKSST